MKFNELEIREEILKAIEDMGFTEATEIQSEAIKIAKTGRDIIAQAQTGTGKTASFVIPMFENLENNDELQALILAPTRELAVQINEEVKKIGKYLDFKSVAVYGGDPIDKQVKLLKENPQVVVGTPGRILDLIRRKKLKFHNMNMFILDEVDEMLNMGFIDDVEEIASKMVNNKQTMMFSATMPDRIKKIAKRFLNDAEHIKIAAKSMTVDKVDQYYTIAKESKKSGVLKNIIDFSGYNKIIIFTQTKRKADEVFAFLADSGYLVDKIHGDLTQKQRLSTIDRFRKGKLNIIVATDVVARGIDIEDVELVVNLELPQDIEYYIHRIGRTGRGNAQKGEAITIVSPNVYKNEFSKYPKYLNCEIHEYSLPTEKEITAKLQTEMYDKLMQMEANNVDSVYYNLVDMFAGEDMRTILARVFSIYAPEISLENRRKKIKEEENKYIEANGGHGNKKKSSNGNRGNRNNGRNRNGNRGSGNRNNGNRGSRNRNNGRSGNKKK